MPNTIASTDVGGTGLSTVGTNGQVLTSNGTVLSWQTPSAGTSFSAGTTGFTPNTATTGTVTLAGTLNIANGGTGLTSFSAGQIHYGSFSQSANLFWDSSNNRLGVGTNTPNGALNVNLSNLSTVGLFSNSGLNISTGGGAVGNIYQIGFGYGASSTYGSSAIYAITTSSTGYNITDIAFATRSVTTDTAPTERMRVTSAGQLLIGSATAASVPSTVNLQSFNNAAIIGADPELILSNTGSDARIWRILGSGSSGATAALRFYDQTAAAERFQIGKAGQWGIGGANYGTSGQVFASGGASAAPSWVSIPYTGTYLVVGGGGGASSTDANNGPGGGGGGGVLTGSVSFTPGVVYTATVGGGGAAQTQANGASSTLTATGLSVTALGGGYGSNVTSWGASSGSSGGGGDGYTSFPSGGAGTTGQGYAGGSGSNTTSEPRKGGGGGGAGGVGDNSGSTGGNGGVGVASTITGSTVYYGGGGGGNGSANGSANGGLGGNGGGGAGGGANNSYTGVAGTANTGGGAGGAGSGTAARAGGSGVVILSVPTANYTGTVTGSPTVTTSGANKILTFTSSGSYTA